MPIQCLGVPFPPGEGVPGGWGTQVSQQKDLYVVMSVGIGTAWCPGRLMSEVLFLLSCALSLMSPVPIPGAQPRCGEAGVPFPTPHVLQLLLFFQ